MGASKTKDFTEKQIAIARFAKALGHPARVAIVEYLLRTEGCICGDIVAELPLAQPTVSQHLRELKNAGIIQGSVDGNAICYCVDEKAIARFRDYCKNITERLGKKRNNCC